MLKNTLLNVALIEPRVSPDEVEGRMQGMGARIAEVHERGWSPTFATFWKACCLLYLQNFHENC